MFPLEQFEQPDRQHIIIVVILQFVRHLAFLELLFEFKAEQVWFEVELEIVRGDVEL